MPPTPIALEMEPKRGGRNLPPEQTRSTRLRHFPVQVPRFLTSPQNKIVREGDTVKFNCLLLSSKEETKTRWEKDRKLLSSQTCSRITTREIDELRILEIRRVTLEDGGLYQISVENSHGRVERTVLLDVIAVHTKSDKMKGLCCSGSSIPTLPSTLASPNGTQRVRGVEEELISMSNRPTSLPPTFLQHLSDVCGLEGQRIELTTKIRGAEEVVWVKNDQLLQNSPYFKYVHEPRKETYKLVIKDAFSQDSGLYICEAYNEAGGSITFANVSITEDSSPSLNWEKSRERVESVNMATSAEKLCEGDIGISSEPEVEQIYELPTTLCTLNGQVEVRGETLRMIPREKSGLHEPIHEEMSPVANNLKGEVTRTTMDMPGDVSFEPSESSRLAEFEASAETPPGGILDSFAALPVFLAKAEVHEPTSALTNSEVEESNNLTDLRHDSGIIAGIEASDLDKSADEENGPNCKVICPPLLSPSYEVKGPIADPLKKTPSIMGPNYLIALKGEQVIIRIKHCGHPQAKVEWTKNGKAWTDIVQNSGLSSVEIKNVSYDDSGRYLATVSDDHGTISHHCFLAVEGPPEPPATPPTVTYNESSGSISISWSGSPYDGGSILTGYIIQSRRNEEEWTDSEIVNSLTYTVGSPTPSASYRFRVKSVNMYGAGLPSVASPGLWVPCPKEPNDNLELEENSLEEADVQIRRGSFQDFYIKGEELGKGRFGVVFNAKHKETGEEFAGKIIRCIKAADKAKVRQEVEIMNILRHPKLLQITDAMETDKEICIITEKINGGELFERVVADDFTLTEFDCIGFMRQICDGVRYIHLKNIIHLDLKPENILCLTRSTYSIKIIDFGLSQKYDNTIPLRVLFGTPEFIAPEIINYEPISPASDLWALGVITYVLLSGLSPFMGESDSETFSNITQGLFDFDDEAFDHISEDAKDFISSLLIRRQDKRLTAAECLEHKWLAYPEPKKNIVIATDKLKRFVIRRKWQKTGNAIRALGRMTNLSRKSGSSDLSSYTGNRKSEDSGTDSNAKTRESSSFEEESEDEVQIEKKRLLLQRQQRVDSLNI